MPRLLGHVSSNVGRYSGFLTGAPNYVKRFKRFRIPRLLYHSGLDEVIQYPQVPSRTLNFTYDILPKAEFAHQPTLTSNATQQWQAVANDVIVKEIYEGGLSQNWEFLHAMYRFWTTLLDPGEYMLWRPFDLTDKVFRMRIVKITVGGDELDPTYVGSSMYTKWMTQTVEVSLKLIPTFPPNVVVFGSAPLATGTLP